VSAYIVDGLNALHASRWARLSTRRLAWEAGCERDILEARLHAIQWAWENGETDRVDWLVRLDHGDPVGYDAKAVES